MFTCIQTYFQNFRLVVRICRAKNKSKNNSCRYHRLRNLYLVLMMTVPLNSALNNTSSDKWIRVVKNVVFWDVAPCRFFYPEDGGHTFLRNVGSHILYTAPHPRRRYSSSHRCENLKSYNPCCSLLDETCRKLTRLRSFGAWRRVLRYIYIPNYMSPYPRINLGTAVRTAATRSPQYGAPWECGNFSDIVVECAV
jgi:hypothetical protein